MNPFQFAFDHTLVVSQATFSIIQTATKGTVGIEVHQGHSHFGDPQSQVGRLHPELERHAVAILGDVELAKLLHSVGFEATEGIGEIEPQLLIQIRGQQ